jgi:hypothetical protein
LPRSTSSTLRQLRSELLYLHFTKRLYVVLLVIAAGVGIAFTGSVSAAASAHSFFLERLKFFALQGVSLADALKAPLTVTRSGSLENIDNPLKYDYLEVSTHVEALRGTHMIGTGLDLVTFAVLPLLFLILGAHLANYDRTSGTLKFRASRERWSRITMAKVLTLAVMSTVATALVGVCALVVSAAGSPLVDRATRGIDYDLVTQPSVSPLVVKLLATAVVAMLFGVAGYAVGVITRSTLWPMIAAAGVLFVVPFASRWDPRNALAVLGAEIYDYWGQFEMRPPLPLSTPLASAVVLGCFAAAGCVVALSARYPPSRSR